MVEGFMYVREIIVQTISDKLSSINAFDMKADVLVIPTWFIFNWMLFVITFKALAVLNIKGT